VQNAAENPLEIVGVCPHAPASEPPPAVRARRQLCLPARDPSIADNPGSAVQTGERAWQDYQRAIHDPATVRAMCEDYRAGLGIARAHDDADLAAGRTLARPVLVIWAGRDDLERLYGDSVAVWRGWAGNVTGLSSTPAITSPRKHPPNWPRRSPASCKNK